MRYSVLYPAILLAACGGGDDSGLEDMSPEAAEYYWKAAARDVVSTHLRDPDSAEFSDLEVFPGGPDEATIICGRVNSRNGFGGMTGPQRFIAGGNVMLEENFTPDQMQIAWTRFCS